MNHLDTSDGEAICYTRIAGDASRPYLVFLHEGLGCIDLWGDFPQRLCAGTGCRGLVYDRAGYGKSSPLQRSRTIHYLHDAALNELRRVIDGLIPGEPYVLVGHSDGGSIALIFAAERPALLRGAITEAAHVFVEDVTIAGIQRADEAFEAGKLKGLVKFHGDKTPGIFKAWSDTWRSPGFRHWNIEYLLPSIACPLLVMQGADDQYATDAQVNAIVTKVGGRAISTMLHDCGHSPHKDQADEVLAQMSDFIATLS